MVRQENLLIIFFSLLLDLHVCGIVNKTWVSINCSIFLTSMMRTPNPWIILAIMLLLIIISPLWMGIASLRAQNLDFYLTGMGVFNFSPQILSPTSKAPVAFWVTFIYLLPGTLELKLVILGFRHSYIIYCIIFDSAKNYSFWNIFQDRKKTTISLNNFFYLIKINLCLCTGFKICFIGSLNPPLIKMPEHSL